MWEIVILQAVKNFGACSSKEHSCCAPRGWIDSFLLFLLAIFCNAGNISSDNGNKDVYEFPVCFLLKQKVAG